MDWAVLSFLRGSLNLKNQLVCVNSRTGHGIYKLPEWWKIMCVCALAMANILIDIFGCFPIQNYYFNSLFSAVVLKPLNSSPVSFLLNLISKSWITCFCCYNTDCVVNFFLLFTMFVCLFVFFIYLLNVFVVLLC